MSETIRYTPDIENQNVDDLVNTILGDIPKIEYAEVKLPSLATTLYGLDTPYLHLRPMTFADEKILMSSKAKKREGINILLSRCIEEKIDPRKLLIQDKLTLLFNLRALSIGPEYQFKMTCKSCEDVGDIKINILERFQCKYAEEPVEATVKTKLPESGKEVVLRRASSYDLEQDGMKVMNELWRFMLSIEGIDNAKVRAQVIEYLPRKDIHYMIEQITLPDIGINQKFLFQCSKCGHEEEEELKLTPDFFSMK